MYPSGFGELDIRDFVFMRFFCEDLLPHPICIKHFHQCLIVWQMVSLTRQQPAMQDSDPEQPTSAFLLKTYTSCRASCLMCQQTHIQSGRKAAVSLLPANDSTTHNETMSVCGATTQTCLIVSPSPAGAYWDT